MSELSTLIVSLIDAGNGLIWNALVYLLLGVGLYFSLRSGFMQFRKLPLMCRLMGHSREGAGGGISSFQAFSTSLAARVGTGNIAGVAVALYLGGPGAVFWMWVTALVGMSTSFVESTLAQAFKTKTHDGCYRGGPAYYIEKGLGQRWLGIAFAVSLIIAFGLAFNGVQANSIAHAMETAFAFDPLLVGIAVMLVVAPIIFGGMRSVARVAEIIVPFMALAYLLVALFVVVTHYSELPAVLSLVLKSAFGIEQAAGGAFAYAVSQAMMQGIKRGLFSNEAGMGSAPNAAAAATTKHPATQGYIQSLGVLVDTIIICSCTAAIVLLSGMLEPGSGLKGVALTQAAMVEHVGAWGGKFIAIAMLLFAFTSLIANYSYGEANIKYIRNDPRVILLYRLLVLGMVVLGSVADLPAVWAFADLSMGVMALINLVAILALSGIAFALMRDYEKQVAQGKDPVFDRSKFPEFERKLDKDVW